MDLLLVSLNNGGKLYGVNSSNVISVVITWFTWWSYHNDIHLKVDQFTQSMHIFTGDQTWSYNIPIAFLTHINKLSFESLREFTGYVDFKFYFKIYTIYWKTVWNIIYPCLRIIKKLQKHVVSLLCPCIQCSEHDWYGNIYSRYVSAVPNR